MLKYGSLRTSCDSPYCDRSVSHEQLTNLSDKIKRIVLCSGKVYYDLLKYREAQKILVEDAPWIFVDHEVQISASSKRVQGFKLHPSFDLRVETISLR